jgi:hypothetical protein
VTKYVALHQINEGTFPSLGALMREIADQVMEYGTLGKIPAAVVRNTRNDMYLASEAIRFLMKDKEADLSKEDIATLNAYKGSLDSATKFIPFWVKLAVAIALGLGTMIGWKRIASPLARRSARRTLPTGKARQPSSSPPARSSRPTTTAFRCRPPTFFRRASPARWRRTAPACRCRRCATSRSPGF